MKQSEAEFQGLSLPRNGSTTPCAAEVESQPHTAYPVYGAEGESPTGLCANNTLYSLQGPEL